MDRPMEGVRITFDGLSRADAGRAVQELAQALVERVGHGVNVSIEKDDPDTQDAGSSLVLLFGTAAAVEIAKGIRAWLSQRSDARDCIMIKTAAGDEFVATGDAARRIEAAALVRAIERSRPR